jgi:hypothetical protein
MKIGYIGNFIPPFSTENDRKKDFEKLGHTITPFQENQTSLGDLFNGLIDLDILIYSHTHGWAIAGLNDVFAECRFRQIPVVTIHLDLWRGLQRWSDVGKEATWSADYIFTPDDTGDWPNDIAERHHYMRPGILSDSCYLAEPNKEKYPHDIIFVGSRGYHHEWKWRPQVIDWLKQTYGNRFGLYGNDGLGVVRQDELNTLYASAKVVVGDSCFGGQIKGYYSDRLTETTGRGGFLLHPKNEWINPHVVQFDLNFEDLKSKIDYWLDHDVEREELRLKMYEYTKEHDTYLQIGKEILDTINAKNSNK